MARPIEETLPRERDAETVSTSDLSASSEYDILGSNA